MLARRDALFDLLDTLIVEGRVASFAYLSQSERFSRKWPSLYSAVEDGQLDGDWLQSFLAQQVPGKGVNIFALDGSPWPRPRARALEDRQYVYQASSDVNGGTVTIGLESEAAGLRPWEDSCSSPCYNIMRSIYDPLMERTAEGLYEPFLAESMSSNDDSNRPTMSHLWALEAVDEPPSGMVRTPPPRHRPQGPPRHGS